VVGQAADSPPLLEGAGAGERLEDESLEDELLDDELLEDESLEVEAFFSVPRESLR
jgi:hypothetical protein